MYAVFRTGGKQYRAVKGDVLRLEKIEADEGATVQFDEVLMVGEGANVKVGNPILSGGAVSGKVLKQGKTKMDLAEQLIDDIANVMKESGASRAVMIWCGSTDTGRTCACGTAAAPRWWWSARQAVSSAMSTTAGRRSAAGSIAARPSVSAS